MAERIELTTLNCKRCQWNWVPRQSEVRICPKCKSAYWDAEKDPRKAAKA